MSEAANPTQSSARPPQGWYVAETPNGERSCVFVLWFYDQTYVSENGLPGGVPLQSYEGTLVASLDLSTAGTPVG